VLRRRPQLPADQLRRTWLTRAQLIAAQVGDPTHNDLLSTFEADPSNKLLAFIRHVVGRRRLVAANANRICAWAKVTDRDGNVAWHGVNYRGQVLVQADQDWTGRFRFTERLYNADGSLVEYRRPALEGQPWQGRVRLTYDEIGPTAQRGWAAWLPAFWARRTNLTRVETEAADTQRTIDDLETGLPAAGSAPPSFQPTLGRYTSITWEPLFNQPLVIEQGSIQARPEGLLRLPRPIDIPHRRTDVVYDYQELSLKVPDDDPASLSGVLDSLRPWGFPWQQDDPAVFAWQLPVPLLGEDVNGDGVFGNRFAEVAPATGPPPRPSRRRRPPRHRGPGRRGRVAPWHGRLRAGLAVVVGPPWAGRPGGRPRRERRPPRVLPG
jgi:hypothetical protein